MPFRGAPNLFLVLSACATCASWIYYFPELKLGDAARAAPIDKQKEGKKKMRQFGSVEIPREAFIAALKMDAD